ncbi:Cation efflux system protein CusA [Acidisarcina polymorpha]|uniref:Cation efflux system protein CusA n=1 Tax=Acidisarcina polymorpha TaxID=2211140 RepID=A0A2Z5FYF4_9BACT|nr:Cation efflux system protein CusA [Acidisarcina polymorpha]
MIERDLALVWGLPIAVAMSLAAASSGLAQGPFVSPTTILSSSNAAVPSDDAAQPLVITLEEAIRRALVNDPAYAASVAENGSARLDHSLARSALLPQASFHGQYLFTQPNGSRNQAGQGVSAQPAPRFIANNAIREYASQILATETISAANIADYGRTAALAARAQADLEVSRRGLIVTVVSEYFEVVAARQKLSVAARAAREADAFVELTKKLEAGREVAHADVVKASLEAQQRGRELEDAQLEAEKASLHLGTLLFPDPRTAFQTADSAVVPPPLPSRDDAQAAAGRGNPDLRSALEAVRASKSEVSASRAAYLPALSFNYIYGIDAPQFAINGPEGVHNLGYSASAGIDVPLWDWFAIHDRVKQSELHEKAAQVVLTSTQRQLVAQLEEYYNEASVADRQLASLDASVSTAQDSLGLTKLRYSAGEATALEVVDAQNALTIAEDAHANGVLRYRVALANLQTLTGAL